MEKWPENTEIAFEEALRVGSHGLETGSGPRLVFGNGRRAFVVGRGCGDMS
jgi:hypothetical protein